MAGRSLERKLKIAQKSSATALTTFQDLNAGIPNMQRLQLLSQEQRVMQRHIRDSLVMDIFEVQLEKGLFGRGVGHLLSLIRLQHPWSVL